MAFWNKTKIYTDRDVEIVSEEGVREGITYIQLGGWHCNEYVEYKWTDVVKKIGLVGKTVNIQYMWSNPGRYNNYRKVISVEVVDD